MRAAILLFMATLLAGCDRGRPSDNEAAGAAVAPSLVPGLWEIRSAVTAARAPNLPILVRDRLIGPRPTRRICITRAQAAQADAAPGAIILNSAYEPQRYALRMAMAEPMPDGTTLRLDIVTAGRRIGDC